VAQKRCKHARCTKQGAQSAVSFLAFVASGFSPAILLFRRGLPLWDFLLFVAP
jgi:hypothetical protein